MLRRLTAVVAALVVAGLLPVVAALSSSGQGGFYGEASGAPRAPLRAAGALAGMAPRFEANQGQFDPAVRFVTRASGYSLFLTPDEAVMALGGAGRGSQASDVVRMRLVGARPAAKITGGDVLGGTSNYLHGNDPAKWVTGVSSFATVKYEGVYEGIDLVYHGDDDGRVEYDFVVAPGTDPGVIAMDYTGAKELRLEPGGGLVIATEAGDLRHHKPVLYQDTAGQRRHVPGRFVVDGNRVSFEVGAYDRALPLVIDPVVGFSTYLGGNAHDEATGIAVDRQGFAYVVGTTTSTSFPTTEGALDRTCGSDCQPLSDRFLVPRVAGLPTGNTLQTSLVPRTPESTPRPDAFVTKLAPDGQVVYSTYLGGTGADEGLAVAVDAFGRAYIAGRTESPDFPTTANALDRTCGTVVDPVTNNGTCNFRLTDDPLDHPDHGQTKADAFVTKLDHAGGLDVAKRAYSTFFGGSGDDTQAGYLFFYPSVVNGFEPGDEIERFVRPEASAGIAVVGETVYLTSSTASTDLIKAEKAPPSAPGYQPARVGPKSACGTDGACDKWLTLCNPLCTMVQQFTDVFVAELDTTATSDKALRYATYLGGKSQDDVARGIAAAAYSDGTTRKTRLYVVSTPEKEPCPRDGSGPGCRPPCTYYGVLNGCERPGVPAVLASGPPEPASLDNLITILPERTGADSLEWSTQIAGRALGVAVDRDGSPYVTGETRKKQFATGGAFQPVHGGEYNANGYIESIEQYRKTDAFVAKFEWRADPDRDRLVLKHATYLGGNQDDVGRAIAVGDDGSVFVTGNTTSFDDDRTLVDEAFPVKDPVQRKLECRGGTGTPGGNCFGTDNEHNSDAFVAGLDGTLEKLVYSTYLGGAIAGPGFADTSPEGLRDVGRAIALRNGQSSAPSVYVSGLSNSRDFPVVDAYRDVNTGLGEGFVTKLVPGGPAPQVAAIEPARGSAAGGTEVVVRGAHLADVSSVSFGNRTVHCSPENCHRSNGQVTVTTPPLFDDSSDSTVAVILRGRGGTSLRNAWSNFTYVDGKWETTGDMSATGGAARSATVLDGAPCRDGSPEVYCGKVLVMSAASADLYDPKSGEWTSTAFCPTNPATETPCPRYARDGHTATALEDGTVLVAGGSDDSMAERYHPGTGRWTKAGALRSNRRRHTATLLTGAESDCGSSCGKVLVVGGEQIGSTHIRPENSAELFDPDPPVEVHVPTTTTTTQPTATTTTLVPGFKPVDVVGHWSYAGVMRGTRFGGHTATPLTGPNCGSNCGKVLVVGGDASRGGGSVVIGRPAVEPPVQLFDPGKGAFVGFETTESPEVIPFRFDPVGHTATVLQGPGWCGPAPAERTPRTPHCGKVLFVGGGGVINHLYDPAVAKLSEAFSVHSGLIKPRTFHSTLLLPGGRILALGGGRDDTEVYDPRFNGGTGGWRPGAPVNSAGPAVLLKGVRYEVDDATCGPNCGKVLMARGTVPTLSAAELYIPAPLPSAISPSSGPAGGGTPVSITGVGFGGGNDMGVYFGTSKVCGRGAARACDDVGSYSSVGASSPAVSDQARADVWVARQGVGIARVPQTFDYIGDPGEVDPFVASARSDSEIELLLGGAGSVGTGNPPVTDYIIKQSRSPITAANFDAGPALCDGGVCRLEFTRVGQKLPLRVTGLRSGTHYYYAARARRSPDQLGPIALANATTTGLPPVSTESELGDDDVANVANQVLYGRGYWLVGLPEGSVVASQSPLYGWLNQGATNAQGQPSTYSTQGSRLPVVGGHGYWAWFSAPKAVTLSGAGVPAMDLSLGGYRASMVGNPSGTAASTISGHDYTARWDPARNGGAGGYHLSGYRQVQDLAVGEGIWAFSYEETTLRLRAK